MSNEKREILESVCEYIERLIVGIDKIVTSFYEGKDKEGCDILAHASEGLEWTVKALELCESEVKVQASVEKLIGSFNESVEAMENEDYILVGDIFNYEVKPVLNEIKDIILKCL